MEVTEITIDVIVYLPDDIAFIIVCLDGTTDVVADDAVMPVTNNLGCRDIAVTVVNPRDEILNWFWSVKCDLTSLGNNCVRAVSLGYVPTAKIVGDRHYSIISDYIGRPVQAYDDNGNIVWQADYDIYGNLRNLHGSRRFIPFRQLGQYEDEETGLYYNWFRYYDPRIGIYISQDPIGLAGNNPTLYAFVTDPNLWKDMFGLDVSSGAGRTHVTYHGIKNGKPYTGYASAPSELGLSDSEIVSRRYGGDFSQFGGRAPEVLYKGEDISRKHTARGLEQIYFFINNYN